MIKRLYRRFHQNFLMRSRIPEYRALLLGTKARGYTVMTVRDLAVCAAGRKPLPPLALVLRSDVDSDVATARAMFEVEKELGIRATYYFRLCTLDGRLMREMQDHGTEVGYHFEEVATAAKRNGFRNPADVALHLDAIREQFRRNIERYRDAAGSLPKTVASHGDFANRKIRMANCCIVNQEIREEFGILAEAYDEWLNAPVTMRLADCEPPKWWSPVPLTEALARQPRCLYVLVHSRQWRANPWENVKADVIRGAEGLMFAATRRIRRGAAIPPLSSGAS